MCGASPALCATPAQATATRRDVLLMHARVHERPSDDVMDLSLARPRSGRVRSESGAAGPGLPGQESQTCGDRRGGELCAPGIMGGVSGDDHKVDTGLKNLGQAAINSRVRRIGRSIRQCKAISTLTNSCTVG